MIGGGLCSEVRQLVEEWRPRKRYGKETGFQKDLHEFLDDRLNQGGGLLDAGGRDIPVTRERGHSKIDIDVDNEVGIELKRDFSTGNKDRLSGQIKSHGKHYPCVIAVTCGISNKGAWRELKNDWQHETTMKDFTIHFVMKELDGSGGGSRTNTGDGGGFSVWDGDSVW